MSLGHIAKQAEKFVTDNSPGILTGLGVLGTVTTAYFAGTGAYKAGLVLADEKRDREFRRESPYIPPKEAFQLTWRVYVPAAGCGAMTIAAIICANRIGTRRAAALAAAYTLSERAYTEYKEKVVEKLGENKERAIRDEIAQDQVQRNQQSSTVVIGTGKVLCCDLQNDRYFESSIEEIKKAQNDTNYQILHQGYASMGDFYDRIGLKATPYSEELGWTSDRQMELVFSATLTDDGRPCMAFAFSVEPIRNYYRIN